MRGDNRKMKCRGCLFWEAATDKEYSYGFCCMWRKPKTHNLKEFRPGCVCKFPVRRLFALIRYYFKGLA